MKIIDESVVGLTYILKNSQGELLDEASKEEPFYYLHGHEQIIPSLEKFLDGQGVGFKGKLDILAKDAYGEYRDQLVVTVPKEHFPQGVNIQPGMRFNTDGPDGTPLVVEVIEVSGENVTLDGNHPLSGMDLIFDLEVLTIRKATSEELEHGHVHGEGGHVH